MPSLSIRATVLLALVLGLVAPAGVWLAVDRMLARQTLEPALERARAAAVAEAVTALRQPLAAGDTLSVQAGLDRLLADPQVCSAAVEGSSGANLARPVGAGRCATDTPLLQMVAPVLHQGQPLARLRLGFDGLALKRQLDERLQRTAWLVGGQLGLAIALVTLLLSWRWLQPLHRLKAQASHLAMRTPPPPPSWSPSDELGQLGQHLNHAQAQVQELFGALEAKNVELQRLALQDHLTGLPNRVLLERLFAQHASAASRHREAMALLFIDLDHFKTINDALGHAAGDQLIVEAARRLERTLRASDIICRMGGDEFVVLLPRIESWDVVATVCERMLQAVKMPMQLRGAAATTQVTASIGVAMYPADAADHETLARMADLAMYRSKELGRARYSFYQPDMDHALQQRLVVEQELKRAIVQGELVLHYQPIFDARHERVVGCEALLRWQHPTRGLLMPGAFIDVAEQTGLIRDIGRITLPMACRQFAEWRDQGRHLEYVAVNVSVLQAHDPTLPDAVKAVMQRYRLEPGQLELELTESALLSNTEGALRTVGRLREAGAVLVVDDFGTGYSSLSYLKMLKPDKMKIDRSFVRDLPADADDRALTQAIIGIADTLSIRVVAEGVETTAQHQLLLRMGCGLQQGYLHGRPVPADDLALQLDTLQGTCVG